VGSGSNRVDASSPLRLLSIRRSRIAGSFARMPGNSPRGTAFCHEARAAGTRKTFAKRGVPPVSIFNHP